MRHMYDFSRTAHDDTWLLGGFFKVRRCETAQGVRSTVRVKVSAGGEAMLLLLPSL